MVLAEISAGKETQLELASIRAFERGDYDAAINFVLVELQLEHFNLELPPPPNTYGLPASQQIAAKRNYYFKISRLLKRSMGEKYRAIYKQMKAPLTISVIGKKRRAIEQ